MSLIRRTRALWIGAGVIAAAIASCGERSLVLLQVESATAVAYSDDTLLIKTNQQASTTFQHVSFDDQNVFKAGVYLSSDVSGRVILQAEVDDPQRNCIVGMGSVTIDGVSAGDTTPAATLKITAVEPCVPLGGGTGGSSATGGVPGTGGVAAGGRGGSSSTGGSSATGGGSGGNAGTPGSGGSGTGGVAGTGGVLGTGGVPGTGGVKGSGGMAGAGGVLGTGGVGGVMGTGGIKGTGGIVATGGVMGTGGIVATGGVMGSGGVGSGGVMGTGGVVATGGVTGSGGGSSCGCTMPNGVCDSTGKCVCSQTDAEACSAAGIGCGSTTNICGQTVDCSCPGSEICDTATGTCRLICVGGTGGIVAASPDIICPLTPAQ